MDKWTKEDTKYMLISALLILAFLVLVATVDIYWLDGGGVMLR